MRPDFGDHNFDQIRSAVLEPDGKILTAGFAISHNGGVQNFALARYTSSGTLDPSFDTDGRLQIDLGSCCQSAYKVLLQTDNKIIAVGYPNTESSDSAFLLARPNTNSALLQPDGKIVAVGFSPRRRTGLPSSQRYVFSTARAL